MDSFVFDAAESSRLAEQELENGLLLGAFPFALSLAREFAAGEFDPHIPDLFVNAVAYTLDELGILLAEYKQGSWSMPFVDYVKPRLLFLVVNRFCIMHLT